MCIVCIEYQKSLINRKEARNIVSEMVEVIDPEHLKEIEKMLSDESDD